MTAQLAPRGEIAVTGFTSILRALLHASPLIEAAMVIDAEGEAVDEVRRASEPPQSHEDFCLMGAHIQIVHRLAGSPLVAQLTLQTSLHSIMSRHLGHGYLLLLKCGADGAWDVKPAHLDSASSALAREAFGAS